MDAPMDLFDDLPKDTPEARARFKAFSRHFKETVDQEVSPGEHQRYYRRLALKAFMGFPALLLAGWGAAALGAPRPLLYALGFVLSIPLHRAAMTLIHGRVHHPRALGSATLEVLVDHLSPLITPWSIEAFRPRHTKGHYGVIGLYASLYEAGTDGVSAEPLGFFANPLLALKALLDPTLASRREVTPWRLWAQIGALGVYYALALGEVIVLGSAFILLCHLLSAVAFTGTIITIGALVHSSQVKGNTFESCSILDSRRATGHLAISLRVLDDGILHGLGRGHLLHHAYPLASTGSLWGRVDHWNDYILKTYPEVRLNRLFLHAVYPETLASLPEPGPLSRGMQVMAALIAAGVGMGMVLKLLPEPAYFLSEHLILDHRIVLRLVAGDPVARRELGRFLGTLPAQRPLLRRLQRRLGAA